MKPDWDTLMGEFKGNADGLVADVDCTADAGKGLCAKMGVEGYPTIKWGDPNALEVYEGDRDLAGLQKFAKENLKPICSPNKLELCDEEKKKEIEKFMARSDDDLTKDINEWEAKISKSGRKLKARIEKLQAKFEEFKKEEKDTVAAVKASGLAIMKSVLAAKQSKTKEEL